MPILYALALFGAAIRAWKAIAMTYYSPATEAAVVRLRTRARARCNVIYVAEWILTDGRLTAVAPRVHQSLRVPPDMLLRLERNIRQELDPRGADSDISLLFAALMLPTQGDGDTP